MDADEEDVVDSDDMPFLNQNTQSREVNANVQILYKLYLHDHSVKKAIATHYTTTVQSKLKLNAHSSTPEPGASIKIHYPPKCPERYYNPGFHLSVLALHR